MMLIPKSIKRKSRKVMETYLKYGIFPTTWEVCYCPRCNDTLNAGWNYQPNYCSNCGQKIDFSEIVWETAPEEKEVADDEIEN